VARGDSAPSVGGGNFFIYRHAGFCEHIPAVFSDVSHQVICRFAPCGTPAVAGFRAVALTHTIFAPGYRRRRAEDFSPCWCLDGKKLIYFYKLFLFYLLLLG